MDIVKVGVAGVVSLLIGGFAGAYVTHYRLTPRLVELQAEVARARDLAAALEDQVAQLTRHSERIEAQSRGLRDQIEGLQQAAAALPPAMQAPQEPAPGADMGNLESLLAAAAAGRDIHTLGPIPEPPAPTGTSDSPWTPEFREARRAEYMNQVRQRTQEFMAQEEEQAADPEVRQRIETLREYADYMIEVMDQLRHATDDDTRDRLQAEFDQVRDTVGQLVREQQDHMIRQLTAEYGVTDPARQQAFADALRRTQAGPFFRAPLLVWGGQYAAPPE